MVDFTEERIREIVDDSVNLLAQANHIISDGELFDLANSEQMFEVNGVQVRAPIFALICLAESDLTFEAKKSFANALMNISSVADHVADHPNLVIDESGKTILQCAVLNNCEPMAEKLITAGASVNAQDNDGNTALHNSIGEQLVEMTLMLLSAGADLVKENDNGETPLDLNEYDDFTPFLDAVRRATERHLIATPDDIDSRSNLWKTRDTIFHYAVRANEMEILEQAKEFGFDLSHEVTARGDTILHHAAAMAKADNQEVIAWILDNVPEIELFTKNNDGDKPADLCSDRIIQELIAQNAWKRAAKSQAEEIHEEEAAPSLTVTSTTLRGAQKMQEEEDQQLK